MASTLGGEAHFFEESMNASKVRSYLASNKESEKSRGMKFLLANMSKGRDMSEFFPDVVKNVVVRAVEVKKMVYMYLVHYADATVACRELALLSINSFQKDLAAANQLIRALALRVMTSIRVPDIVQIQLLAVFKCAADSSPYVRRCAATAIPKLYAMDASQLPQLTQALERLLKDSSTMVLGAAVAAFNEACPAEYALLHRCYRKLCHLLADMDEWTQIAVLTVLMRYVRAHFTDPAPAPGVTQAQAQAQATALAPASTAAMAAGPVRIKRRVVRKAFYSDEEDVSEEEEVEVMPGGGAAFAPLPQQAAAPNALFHRTADAELDEVELDPDHKLLLRSSLPLLKSRNCGVVLAVCALHYYCGTQTEALCAQLGKSLVRISRNRREIAFVVLQAIAAMARERPGMFRPFLPDFFVKATDPSFCRALKLDILTALVDPSTVTPVLRELQSYVKHADKAFVCAAVRAVGRVADAQPEVAPRCLHGLMGLLACVRSELVAGQAVVVIRQLLQQRRATAAAAGEGEGEADLGPVVKQLASVLISEKGQRVGAEARASLVWIVGEFIGFVRPAAPDVLRLLAKGFAEEAVPVKMQVVNLAVKLYLHHHKHKHRGNAGAGAAQASLLGGGGDGSNGGNGSVQGEEDDGVSKLVRYVLELARFDGNYDLRDRTRLLTASLGLAAAGGVVGGSEQVDAAALVALRAKAEEVFLPPKLPPLVTLQAGGPMAAAGRGGLTVGSLSWMLHHKVPGYQELPDWAPLPSDPAIRDPPQAPGVSAAAAVGGVSEAEAPGGPARRGAEGMFYSEDEEGSSYESGEESSSSSSRGGGSSSELDSYSGSESESDASASASASDSGSSSSASSSSPSSASDGAETEYSSYSSSSGSASPSDYSSDDEGTGGGGGGGGGGNGKGGAGGGGHKRQESRRAGYDELGLGLSPPRPTVSSSTGDGDDAGLLDLDAYAQAKRSSGGGKGKGGGGGEGETEGDLAEILQGLHTTSLGATSTSSSSFSSGSKGPPLSVARRLLRPETAGGLAVEAAFVRDDKAKAKGNDTRAVVLRFHNGRDAGAGPPLRHIRVTAAGAADHSRLVPPLPEVAVLEAGAAKEVSLLLDLKEEPSPGPVRLQIVTDRGQYPATLPVPHEELLVPQPPPTLAEAQAWQRALGGIHECRAAVALEEGEGLLASVPDRVLQAANLALVSAPAHWAEGGSAMLAAKARAGGRVVVQLEATTGEGEGEGSPSASVSLRVQADDAMLSASLLEALRRALTAAPSAAKSAGGVK